MKKAILFFGLTTWDIVYELEHFLAWDSKNNARAMEQKTGGPSFGAAKAALRLGAEVCLATVIGQGGIAEECHREIDSLSLPVLDAAREDRAALPIASVAQLPDGRRALFTTKPTWNQFPDNFPSVDWSQVEALCLDGHYLAPAIRLAKQAKARGIPVFLDGGSWKDGLESLLPFVDEAIVSQYFLPPRCAEPAEVLSFLQTFGGFYAITRGDQSILLSDGDDIPVEKVDSPVQTNGAGDVLHGAYAHFRVLGHRPRHALECAAQVATEFCKMRI